MRRIIPAAVGAAILLAVLLLALPAGTAEANSRVWPTGYWGPLLSCTGNYNQVVPPGTDPKGVKNICTSFCDILQTGQNVIDFAMTLALFIGVPVMITLGGILLMISGAGGEEEKRKAAKDMIVSAVIGAGITLGAYLILSTFLWLFGNGPTSAVQVSWPEIKCNIPPAP